MKARVFINLKLLIKGAYKTKLMFKLQNYLTLTWEYAS